jgi:soluble lytic murein transglycosylase
MKDTRLRRFAPALCMIVLFWCDVSWAEIYKRQGADGRVEFTDRPTGAGWTLYMKDDGRLFEDIFARHRAKSKTVEEIMKEIAEEYNIDLALLKAVIAVESNMNPHAVSRKGAQGLMQLMPRTARELNVQRPFDPRENIIGGVKYIKGLMASYGDLRLALAAYNAGPGAVKKHEGIPPYRETIGYVKKVIHYYKKFKHDSKARVAIR